MRCTDRYIVLTPDELVTAVMQYIASKGVHIVGMVDVSFNAQGNHRALPPGDGPLPYTAFLVSASLHRDGLIVLPPGIAWPPNKD